MNYRKSFRCLLALLLSAAAVLSLACFAAAELELPLSVEAGGVVAYAFDSRTVILCCVAAALDVLCLLFAGKLPGVVTDIATFAAAVLTALAFCTVIQGRILLIGYIYFSDLESSNPVAIAAMNLAIAAWVFYLAGLIVNFVVAFSRHEKD